MQYDHIIYEGVIISFTAHSIKIVAHCLSYLLKRYGAAQAICTWRTKPMGFKWPSNVSDQFQMILDIVKWYLILWILAHSCAIFLWCLLSLPTQITSSNGLCEEVIWAVKLKFDNFGDMLLTPHSFANGSHFVALGRLRGWKTVKKCLYPPFI